MRHKDKPHESIRNAFRIPLQYTKQIIHSFTMYIHPVADEPWGFLKIGTGVFVILFVFGMITSQYPLSAEIFNYALIIGFIVWLIFSIRKYGWLDTLEFLGLFPFFLIAATISAFHKASPKKTEPDIKAFSDEAEFTLIHSINDAYEGKLIEKHTSDGYLYFTVEAPYGLRIPEDRIIADIAQKLQVSRNYIRQSAISDLRSYYSFSLEAVSEYEKAKAGYRPMETFSEIWQRMLLKRKGSLTQISPQASPLI